MQTKFPALFSPLSVAAPQGGLLFKNRMISAPISPHYLSTEGYVTAQTIAPFELLAKGGVAAVTIGESLVHSKTGNNHGAVLRLDDPGVIPGLYQLTDTIHRYGALASIELVHPGVRADPKYNTGHVTYGPSGGFVHYGDGRNEIVELSEEMIETIVGAFGDAAQMAQLAGCDYVTVHGGHGWLLNQFLSPANNRRTDRFGGSLENRARIYLMVADDIRRKCGPGFVIDFRISGDDFMPEGATQEEVIGLCEMLDGHIDMLHVSATSFHNRKAGIRMFPSMFTPRGVNAFLAEGIKKHVHIPVVTVGGFNDPAHMDSHLAAGKADLIAMARALLADPFLPEKARLGMEGDITYCTRCNNCLSVSFVPYVKYNLGVSHCSVNPWHGLQAEYLSRKVPQGSQKVLVVGGGPAGLQAALGAAECGHRVELCERSGSLGGILRFAGFPSFKQDVARYVETLKKRVMANPHITVRLLTAVNPEDVAAYAPDALIVAIGSEPIWPGIPGLRPGAGGAGGGVPCIVHAIDLHTSDTPIGDRVVVIGAGQVGLEEAIALADAGKDVTVLEMGDRIARDAVYLHYLAIQNEIDSRENLHVVLNTRCEAVGAQGVGARAVGVGTGIADAAPMPDISAEGEDSQVSGDTARADLHVAADSRTDGKCTDDVSGSDTALTWYPADTVVVAAGMRGLWDRAQTYLGMAPSVAIVGDCKKTSQMAEAILAGYFAGYNLQRV
ncbi:MAG: NAD(P)/FAD-dependent oxidoreductase [Lachnospiraceae bacterium]|jgi:2,4-dienoyl-CoA reductase-like NADH-dependent reductase (Old Yellow Enzyme family)/thioredoxin reductase|nr:NAD(P)/FAD-dependent oxidoreductase [Lachnospiraceae bacterium]